MERTFLEIKRLDKNIDYDGSQLNPHWIYRTTGIMGDVAVCFIGACNVLDDKMVDLEDVLAKNSIRSSKMLHFIVEIFERDCAFAAALQSVFMSEIQNELYEHGVKALKFGDDIFVGDGKLSIAIATVSPVSALMHMALNISNKGTPVKTSALEDFGIDPENFADAVMKRFNAEYSRIILAACKVLPRG